MSISTVLMPVHVIDGGYVPDLCHDIAIRRDSPVLHACASNSVPQGCTRRTIRLSIRDQVSKSTATSSPGTSWGESSNIDSGCGHFCKFRQSDVITAPRTCKNAYRICRQELNLSSVVINISELICLDIIMKKNSRPWPSLLLTSVTGNAMQEAVGVGSSRNKERKGCHFSARSKANYHENQELLPSWTFCSSDPGFPIKPSINGSSDSQGTVCFVGSDMVVQLYRQSSSSNLASSPRELSAHDCYHNDTSES
ncbi:uncharacterized protein EDB93DRAFT_1103093 [Suillus bovinus]|uniref:uncharacterized protein n=1 Tax=Suillus bovinus TaxID=48563 RepID=UPI001B882AAA|nr:uncharacterized protein EDB93DRAFT_1103093 [Suillus bovinus]KAG2151662.1 hypothetical protein EDB93DRAFT_1103093 [Suillus bovinus]